jgi:hypothetical protein
MNEAKVRRASKLQAMVDYLKEAIHADEEGDEYEYREQMELLMGAVGSEVALYGGVVPKYEARPSDWDEGQ